MGPALAPTLDALADRVARPLDRVRAWVLRRSGAIGRRFIRDRALRVEALALTGLATALALTLTLPVWLLVIGPLVLGIPHLLADVRYLVVRPGLHRDRGWWAWCVGPLALYAITQIPWIGAAAVLGAAWHLRVPVLLLVGAGALTAAAYLAPSPTLWAFLHAHNLIAVGLWWHWRPGPARRLVPVVVFLVVYAAILLGAFDGILLGHAFSSGPDAVPRADVFARLAAGIPAPWDTRIVASFAFAQSVHYGVWLRWIPEDDRPRYTPRPVAASYRAVRDELGHGLLTAFALLFALVLGVAWIDLSWGRTLYFAIVASHGWLELACLVRGTRPGAPLRPALTP